MKRKTKLLGWPPHYYALTCGPLSLWESSSPWQCIFTNQRGLPGEKRKGRKIHLCQWNTSRIQPYAYICFPWDRKISCHIPTDKRNLSCAFMCVSDHIPVRLHGYCHCSRWFLWHLDHLFVQVGPGRNSPHSQSPTMLLNQECSVQKNLLSFNLRKIKVIA